MSIIKSRDLPDWLNPVLDVFNKKYNNESALEKTAATNVKNLPKIVWNDETFYSMFDADGATIFNEFGNIVTTIKGAATIEAVDQHLNGKQVVTSEVNDNVFAEELQKVSAYLDVVEAEGEQTDPNAPADEFSAPEEQAPNNETDQTGQDLNGLESDIDNTTASLEIMARFAEMEEQMKNMQDTISTLQEQVRAYTDPGAVYDLGVEQAEQQHFEESAQQSAEQIDKEHNVDLTTMQGRISLVDKVMDDIDSIMNADESTLDITEEDLSDISEMDNLSPEDEDKEDDLVELDIPDMDPIVDDSGDSQDIEVEVDEVPVEETPDEDSKEEPEDEDEKSEEKPEEDPEDDSEDEKEEIVKLNARDANIFKEQLCVVCGQKKLTLANKVANMQGVYCKCCNAEYAVDMNNEDIFQKV